MGRTAKTREQIEAESAAARIQNMAHLSDRELVRKMEQAELMTGSWLSSAASRHGSDSGHTAVSMYRDELARRRAAEPTEAIVPSTKSAPDPDLLGGRFSTELPGGGVIHGRFALVTDSEDAAWFAIHVDETADDESEYDMASVRMMPMPPQTGRELADVLMAKAI